MAHLLYRFGNCTVDPAARELRYAGELVTLSPRVFDCLAYLIEHRDRAVGRDELIAAVWGRVDVTDALLGQTILKARRAVADSGDGQNVIRTIPRFGYRWVAEIGVENRPAPPANLQLPPLIADPASVVEPGNITAPADPSLTRRHISGRKLIAYIGVAMLVVIAAAWFMLKRHDAITPAQSPVGESAHVIAVLPVVVDASPEWSWLRLGLMDLIAVRLRNAGLNVVPSDNVVALTRTGDSDAETMAEAVRVATGARQLLAPKATHTATGWLVRLDVHGDDDDLEVEAHDDDAVAATRTAVTLLLDRLGKHSATQDGPGTLSLATIQQRAEAALLTDDLSGARRIIEAAPAALRAFPELRLQLARVDLRGGQMAAARQHLEGLLREISAEANPVLRARVLTTLSSVARYSDENNAEALRACSEAVALLTRSNDLGALGRAYTGCGVANASAGRYDAAMADFARARIALEVTGDALSIARVEANEGVLETKRGHYAEGMAMLRQAADRFRRFGARNELILSMSNEVDAHLALLQPGEALAASERGWAQLPQHENADTRRELQLQHARALAANGRIGEAAALLSALANAVIPGQEQSVLGLTRATQARLELESGRAPAAIIHARAAVAALAHADDARERGMAWLTLVRALHAVSSSDEASVAAQEFSSWAATVGITATSVYAGLADAELRWVAQRNDAATAYEHALHDAESAGIPADVVAVAVSWGHAAIDAGDLERASSVIGRVARWADSDFACSLLQTRLYQALGREAAWHSALQRARGLAGERSIPPWATGTTPALTPPPSGH